MNRPAIRPKRPMRLATRFALAVATLVPLLVLLSGLLVLRLASQDLAAERDRQLTVRLRALTPLATTYAQRARRNKAVTAELSADRLSAAALGADSPGGLYIQVPGADPLVVGDVPVTPPQAASAAGAAVRPSLAGQDARLGAPPVPAGPASYTERNTTWRFAAIDLGRRGAAGRMWVFEREQRLEARIALLRRRLLLATVLAVGVGAAAGLAVGRIAVRPLTVLRDQARGVDAHPRRNERLATASGVTEVDELARLLNELLDRRDAAVQRTGAALDTARAFAATAAHELRTPLTSMRTNLALLDHPGLPAGERAEIVADLTAEHARLQGLITVLRQLARADLVDPASFTEVDLGEIAGAAADDARRRHDVQVRASPAGDVMVHGWAEGLRMIVDNLLDNAAVHGRPPIALTVAAEPHGALLIVEDNGPGIPPEERQAVFGRFHRRPGSPGSGLGLTLIRQLVALHGGTITVTDARGPAGPPDLHDLHGSNGPNGGPEPAPRPGAGPVPEPVPGPRPVGTRVEIRLPRAGRAQPPPSPSPSPRNWLSPGPPHPGPPAAQDPRAPYPPP